MGIRIALRCPLTRSIRDVQSCIKEQEKLGCDYLGCSAYRGSVIKRWMELTRKEKENGTTRIPEDLQTGT